MTDHLIFGREPGETGDVDVDELKAALAAAPDADTEPRGPPPPPRNPPRRNGPAPPAAGTAAGWSSPSSCCW